MIIPTKGQAGCIDSIAHWYKYLYKQGYTYTGPAGSGKSTIAPMVMDRLGLAIDEVLFVAFTGKAASLLSIKGLNASTIHSSFFELKEVPLVVDGNPVIRNGRVATKLVFTPVQYISSRIKLIWVEECSMVDKYMRDVIFKFGIPVVAMGDRYQLPALFGESPFFDEVDYELWEITRQAEGSGIIQLATLLREGRPLNRYMNFKNQARVLSKKFLNDRHLLNADIVLTAKNKTRETFNDRIRMLHGSIGPLPSCGDKLVCRKNNRTMQLQGVPLTNGTIGKVINPVNRGECNLKAGLYAIDFQPDFAVGDKFDYYDSLICDYEYLNQPCGAKEVNIFNKGAKMEYGEAITVHLSQGSQFPNVVYYDEIMGDAKYMRRLRYTAVTRAVDEVNMFI